MYLPNFIQKNYENFKSLMDDANLNVAPRMRFLKAKSNQILSMIV